MKRFTVFVTTTFFFGTFVSLSVADKYLSLENANPLIPIADPPLGIGTDEEYPKLTDFPDPSTPETVRLGRWLFYDKRLSTDGTMRGMSRGTRSVF